MINPQKYFVSQEFDINFVGKSSNNLMGMIQNFFFFLCTNGDHGIGSIIVNFVVLF